MKGEHFMDFNSWSFITGHLEAYRVIGGLCLHLNLSRYFNLLMHQRENSQGIIK